MQTIPVLGSVLLVPSETQEPPPPATFALEWEAASDRLRLEPLGERLLGFDSAGGGLTRRHYLERVRAEDLAKLDDALRAVSPGASTFRVRYRIDTSEARQLMLEEHAMARFGADGRLSAVASVVADVTALARREEALRSKEQALGAWLEHQLGIMDRVPAMFMLFDPSFQLVRVNREVERVLGWTSEDFKTRSMLESCYPEAAQRAAALAALTAAEAGWHDVRATAKDGTQVDVSWSTVSLTPERRLSIGIDVRERARVLARLRESEAELRANLGQLEGIYANAPVALCVLDRDLRFVRANAQVGALNRVDPAQLIGRTIQEVLPDLSCQMAEFVARILHDGKPAIEFEIRGETPDRPGDERVWVQSGWPLKDAGGEVAAINIAAREVTDSRRTARRLAESEARFRNVAETVPDILFTADAEGRVDFITPRYRQLTGIAESDVLGMQWLAMLHPDDRERVAYAWRVAVGERSEVTLKYRLKMLDGTYRWMETRARPVQEDATGVVKWYGTASDIDELVRAHEALEAADRQKNEFLAILGHELRNPMAPVRSAVDLMERIAPEDPQLRWAIDIVDRQSEHMGRLLDDLLDVSRIVRGKLKLQKRICALDEIVAQAVDVARPLMDEREHRFEITLSERRLCVRADPVRLVQVLVNLLNNAAKYTPQGGHVQLIVEGTGRAVIIRVIDNGDGIDPELSEGMFDAFTQGARRLDRSPGGLGLGLAIAARLAEMHGGTIRAHSEGRGKGAELVLRLPVVDGEPEPLASRACAVAPPQDSVKVLVVDDNVDIAQSMAALLRALGHEVEVALSGQNAIVSAGLFQPRVVLLDIGMEDMDGFETARRLRALEPEPQRMLLVAVSGYGDAGTQARGRNAGFDVHLTKPVGRQVLCEVLRSLDDDGDESAV